MKDFAKTKAEHEHIVKATITLRFNNVSWKQLKVEACAGIKGNLFL